MKYLITGATGHLGSAIVDNLLHRTNKENIIAGVHTPQKAKKYQDLGIETTAIEYNDLEILSTSFAKADLVVYIPSKSHTSYERVTELENVIQALQRADVKQLITMSFVADQENNPFTLSAFYGYLPRRLAQTDIRYTILRNVLYADPLVPYLPELIERHNVIYPVGNKALSFISLSDSAKAFAKVITTPEFQVQGKIYTLSQNRNYTMIELSKLLSKVSDSQIGYQPVTVQEFGKIYNENNEGKMLSSMYAGGAMGLLSEVSDDYEVIMGRSAQDLQSFIEEKYRKEK